MTEIEELRMALKDAIKAEDEAVAVRLKAEDALNAALIADGPIKVGDILFVARYGKMRVDKIFRRYGLSEMVCALQKKDGTFGLRTYTVMSYEKYERVSP